MRELLLRACQHAFGHRLMMDCVIPGGVAADLGEGGADALQRRLGEIADRLPAVRQRHDDSPLASRLSGLGCAAGATAILLGAGGVVGRASGRRFDARAGYMPAYSTLPPAVASGVAGDAAARAAVRLSEIDDSLRLVGIALETLPAGPIAVTLPQISGEGIACAESSRGDIWHWLRIDHGQVAAVFPRDPGWALWPLAEAVLENAMAEDAGLIMASCALPVSGVDL
jgi:Ni,Fe-hydrogenase III large subunit